MSCASAGNCSAGGYYKGNGTGRFQAFVVSQKNGAWGRAREVRFAAPLQPGGDAQVYSVSCGSAGNCSAGGSYSRPAGTGAFVVSQKNGVWGKARRSASPRPCNAGGAP